jgi:hypothetical protein
MPEYPPTFTESMCAVQANLPKITKGETALVRSDKGSYTYKFADLADVSEGLLPLIAAQGLAFVALPLLNEDKMFVLRYALRHASGEEVGGDWPLPDPTRTRPQEVGSAITYARRYTLCSVTGLSPDRDDDAAAASTGESWENATRERPTVREPNARPARSGTRSERTAKAREKADTALADTPESLRAEIAKAVDRGVLGAIKERVTELGLEGAEAADGVTLLSAMQHKWRVLPPAPWKPNAAQLARLHALLHDTGVDTQKHDEKMAAINHMLPADRFVDSTKELTLAEYDDITARLENIQSAGQRPKAKAKAEAE